MKTAQKDCRSVHIKFITTSLAPKGPTRQLSYLARLNADRDVTFTINSIRRPREGDWPHLFNKLRLHLVFGWRRALAIRDVEVVHTTGFIPDLMGWFLSNFRPWVVTVRNFPVMIILLNSVRRLGKCWLSRIFKS